MTPHTERASLAAAAVLLLLTIHLSPAPAAAQEMPSPEEWTRIMQEHQRAGQPGPEHEELARMVGTWDMEVTMWPAPGAEAMKLPPAVVEATTLLGGRFLQQHSLSQAGEAPIEMLSILGFDRRNDLYTLVALDTTGTYWVTAAGPRQPDGSIVMSGADWDGIVGHEQQYDFVLRWEDDDTLVTQIIFKDAIHTRGGPPFKMVETVSRRRASATRGSR